MPVLGFRKQDASYALVHYRLGIERGRASGFVCDECGSPAKDWAYDNLDANEKYDEKGRPYSEDLSHYRPMCRSCHRAFDAKATCRKGHDFTEVNTYWRRGARFCRACRREYMHDFRARRAST